jgi:hypothetical protein
MSTRPLVTLALVLAWNAMAGCPTAPVSPSDQAAPPTSEPAAAPAPAAPNEGPTVHTRGFVGADVLVARHYLGFEDPTEGAAFDRIDACFSERAVSADWHHYPLRLVGQFVSVDRCRGRGARHNCGGGTYRGRENIDVASLSTFRLNGLSSSQGLRIDAVHRGGPDQLKVAFYWASNGGSLMGSGLHVTFQLGNTRVGVYDRFSEKLHESTIELKSAGTKLDIMTRLRASPEALKAELMDQIDRRETKVKAMLDANAIVKCIYGAYNGRGIPPRCEKRVPISGSELVDAHAKLEAGAKAQRALVNAHYPELFKALEALMPAACFSGLEDPKHPTP